MNKFMNNYGDSENLKSSLSLDQINNTDPSQEDEDGNSLAEAPSMHVTDSASAEEITANNEQLINGYTDKQFNAFKSLSTWA